ncbi:MAG: type II toxin-antitoxin system HicA family toxin [Actinomycetota bacterium]
MPELPVVSGSDAVKALERFGFRRVRQKGSHVVLRRGPNGCVVPLHRETKRGTLAAILRQAKVSTEEFVQALK